MRSKSAELPWNAGGPDTDLVRLIKEGRVAIGPTGRQALDIGTGPGHDAVFLMQHGFDVIAIDISPSAILLARENASHHGLFGFFQQGDIRQIPVENDWVDFAMDRGCFHTLDVADRAQALAEVVRVLKPNGLFFLKTFSDREMPGDLPHRFTRQELEETFAQRFSILELKDSEFNGPIRAKAYTLLMKKR